MKTIFSNSYEKREIIRKDIIKDKLEIFGREDVSDEDIEQSVYSEIEYQFDDIMYALDTKLDNDILAIADIGTWRGRFSGYKMMGRKLSEILYGEYDTYEVYFEGKNVRATGHHHDGTNYIEFRMIRDGVDIDNLTDDIYNQKEISRARINYYTESLMPYVKEALEY